MLLFKRSEMEPIFKEVPPQNDESPVSHQSTVAALTPISPFTFFYLQNLSSLGAFSFFAEAETKKADEIKQQIKTVCKCSKTKCLKLYCECFSDGKLCEDCDCKGCHNTAAFTEEREAAVIRTKNKNPRAFRDDISANYKICHCAKSYCMKKYCECFQSGRPCNPNCKCKQCKNHHSS